MPSWGHLWFVAYLLAYTLLLAAALAWLPRPVARLGEWLSARLSGWALLIVPILYLAVIRILLYPSFEVTHAFFDDWYNHAVSFPAFLLGFLVLKDGRVAERCIRLRWLALALFLGAYAAYASYAWAYRAEDALPPEPLLTAMRIVYAIDQWCAIVAAVGFGARHLQRDSALLRTLTLAVFPFYIVHQTIIIVAGHHLAALRLPVLAEAALLIGLTALGCWLAFEAARRSALLRPLFGLGPRAAPSRPLDPALAAP